MIVHYPYPTVIPYHYSAKSWEKGRVRFRMELIQGFWPIRISENALNHALEILPRAESELPDGTTSGWLSHRNAILRDSLTLKACI